jgi:hypothetical protein
VRDHTNRTPDAGNRETEQHWNSARIGKCPAQQAIHRFQATHLQRTIDTAWAILTAGPILASSLNCLAPQAAAAAATLPRR